MKIRMLLHGFAAVCGFFVAIPQAAGEADFADTACVDALVAKVVADPKLDSPFFKSTQSSYPWNYIEHDDGTLEDALGGKVDKRKVKKIEHTADCVSSHQGEHVMAFCEAKREGNKVVLLISGGMPAYASSLKVVIDGNQFTCLFEAFYPGGRVPLRWRITKKELRVRDDSYPKGKRILGWIAVEFEETLREGGKISRQLYKIEGYLKPVLQ